VVAVDVNSRAMAPDKAGLAAAAAVATLCSPVRRSWTKADGGRLGVLRRYRMHVFRWALPGWLFCTQANNDP
jgi:hypothetical protein